MKSDGSGDGRPGCPEFRGARGTIGAVPRRPAPPRARPAASAHPGAPSGRGGPATRGAPTVRPGTPTARPGAPADRSATRPPQRPTGPQRTATAPEPAPRRVGGIPIRMLVLGVVVLMAFAVLFPTVRAFLSQRNDLNRLEEQVLQAEATEGELRAELDRWQDPAFVVAQARERLQYVLPGETSYRVIDPEVVVEQSGDAEASATGPTVPVGAEPRPWYLTVWQSVVEAGAVEVAPIDAADPEQEATSDAPATDPPDDVAPEDGSVAPDGGAATTGEAAG